MLIPTLLAITVRLGLAAVFLYAGADKLRHWPDSVTEVSDLRLPLPRIFAARTIFTQLTGGALVVAGGLVAPAAAMLAAFTIAATLLGHRFWLLHGQPARREFTTALEHVAIVAGLVQLAMTYAAR